MHTDYNYFTSYSIFLSTAVVNNYVFRLLQHNQILQRPGISSAYFTEATFHWWLGKNNPFPIIISYKFILHLKKNNWKKFLLAKLSCTTVRKAVLKNKLLIKLSQRVHQSLFQNLLEANLTIWKCLLHYWNSLTRVLPINILIYTCQILTHM